MGIFLPDGPRTFTVYKKGRFGRPFMDIFKADDREDVLGKLKIMTKYTIAGSLGLSLFDIALWSPQFKQGAIGAVKRVGFWTIPMIGGGIAYCAAVSTAANIRNKNDSVNHFIAGASAGTVIAARGGNPFAGVAVVVGLGLLSVAFKEAGLKSFEVFKEFPITRPQPLMADIINSNRRKDIPGYWVRDQKDVAAMQARGPLYTNVDPGKPPF